MNAQLDFLPVLFPQPIPAATRPGQQAGHLRCECDLVFWHWPITGKPATSSSREGPPDLRPWHLWTCFRQISRATPQWKRKAAK